MFLAYFRLCCQGELSLLLLYSEDFASLDFLSLLGMKFLLLLSKETLDLLDMSM